MENTALFPDAEVPTKPTVVSLTQRPTNDSATALTRFKTAVDQFVLVMNVADKAEATKYFFQRVRARVR